VAPDSFGGTLTAAEAAAAIGGAFADAGFRVDLAPMSDGGPGFVDVLPGTEQEITVNGPLGSPVTARFRVQDGVAYVESAQACGLHLLAHPDPEHASTAGVGELLTAAAECADTVYVGLGGSATTDGGRGMLATYRGSASLVAATDVDNPLLGPHGAAAVFGPQKGASPAQVARLEERLREQAGDHPARNLPGAGAAGGLGFALFTLGATRVSGAALVADALDLDARIAAVDLVVTGEGRYDHTSLRGKVVAEVTRRCQPHGVPCIVVAGSVEVGAREAAAHGVTETWDLTEHCGDAALTDPRVSLQRLAARIAGQWR
jgi:glycerate kinase